MTYLYLLCFSHTFASISGVAQWIAFVIFNRQNRQLKPITCSMCLAFWLVLIYQCCEYLGYHSFGRYIDLIGPAFVCFVVMGIYTNAERRLL